MRQAAGFRTSLFSSLVVLTGCVWTPQDCRGLHTDIDSFSLPMDSSRFAYEWLRSRYPHRYESRNSSDPSSMTTETKDQTKVAGATACIGHERIEHASDRRHAR